MRYYVKFKFYGEFLLFFLIESKNKFTDTGTIVYFKYAQLNYFKRLTKLKHF